MRVLIDTNVILDVLCKREGFYEDAAQIIRLCETDELEGFISVLTISNIVYIMRKELDTGKTRDIIEKLQLILSVADLKGEDIKTALTMNFNDFEDALQTVCALRINADYIITRNIRDFTQSAVKAIKPSEFLQEFNE